MTVSVFTVAASADDASGNGTPNTTATSLAFGPGTWIGWRFQNVTVPPGSVIQSAVLRVYFGSGLASARPAAQIYGSLQGSAAANPPQNFVVDPIPIGTRQSSGEMTSGYVSFGGGLIFPLPAYMDIDVQTAIEQALGGFHESGDAVALYALTTGSDSVWPVSFYDRGAEYAARLTITWQGDVESLGTTGSIALAGNTGSFDVLPPPVDITGATGSIELTGNPGDGQYLSDAILADSPVGYWPFSEPSGTVAEDASGLGHDGAYTNTPTLAQPSLIPSTFRTSVDFAAASSEYVLVPDHDDLDPGDVFSLEIVHRPSSIGATNRTLFDKGTNGYNLTLTTGGLIQLQKRGEGVIANSTVALAANTNYHIVVTKNGSAVNIYINGTNVTGAVTNRTIVATATGLHIGRASGSSNYVAGRLQDAALYPAALTPEQVAAHYAAYTFPLVITTLIDIEGETGSIDITGEQGAYNTFAPDDDLTYGGLGVYGGTGLYDGPTLDQPQDSGRTRIDIYGPDGEKLAIPPITAFTASYLDAIDEIGSFSYVIPASLESASVITQGMRLHLYVEGEGEVFRGIAREFTWEDGPEGDPRLRVEGPGTGDDLVATSMLLGRSYLDQTPLEMLTDMISLVDGWAVGIVSSPVSPAVSSVSAEGESVLGAMRQVAERFHYHTRANPVEQTVDMGAFGLVSGLRLTNLPAAAPGHEEEYPMVVPILDMQVVEEGHDIWNSVLPHGAGEGTAALTLEFSTRTEPYTIHTAIAPDGRTLYYLEDDTSIATYGRRQRVIVDKHSVPLGQTEAALQAAANALYDAGVEYLLTSSNPTHTYRISPGSLKHLVEGVPQFRLGETVEVTYRGRAELVDGSGYLYLDINQTLYLSSYRRTIGDDAMTWDMDVQDVLGRRMDAARRMADLMDQLWSSQVEPLLADVNLPGEDKPGDLVTSYTVTIDARRVFWISKATITFTIAGGGAWAGTVTINGDDRTTDLGGPFTRGVEYEVDVRPYLTRFDVNEVIFAHGTPFGITAVKQTSGVGIPGQLP